MTSARWRTTHPRTLNDLHHRCRRPHHQITELQTANDATCLSPAGAFAVSHGVSFCVAMLPMLIMARRLIAGVLAEDPFSLRTVRRLRVLGAVVLAGGAASEPA